MKPVFHTEKKILELEFTGLLSRDSIPEAFALFRDARFTAEHQLLIDLSGAAIGFSLADLSFVGSAIEQSPALRPAGARTAWVIETFTDEEILRLSRFFVPRWDTVWKFLREREAAMAHTREPLIFPRPFIPAERGLSLRRLGPGSAEDASTPSKSRQ